MTESRSQKNTNNSWTRGYPTPQCTHCALETFPSVADLPLSHWCQHPAQLGKLFAKTEPKFSTCGRSFAELAPGCCQSKRSHHASWSQGGKQSTAPSILLLSLWHLVTGWKSVQFFGGIFPFFILPFRVPLPPLVGRCRGPNLHPPWAPHCAPGLELCVRFSAALASTLGS